MNETKQNMIEAVLVLAIILVVLAFSSAFEKPLTMENGLTFDALQYFSVAQKFESHQHVIGESPFVYRIGLPFLVSVFFPEDLFTGFRLINLAGAFISIFLLLIWFRLHLKNIFVRLWLIVLFSTHWVGVLRLSYYSPVHVESLNTVFNLVGFILVYYLQKNPKDFRLFAMFCTVIFLGVFFRESVIFLAAIYFAVFIHGALNGSNDNASPSVKEIFLAGSPLLLGLISFGLTRTIASPDNEYSLLANMVAWTYQKPFPTYLQSYFTTYGPMLALLVPAFNKVKDFLAREKFYTYYLAFICLIAWGIGSDTDRFLFWAMPVVYTLLGLAMEQLIPLFKKQRMVLISLIFLQLLAQRSFLPYEEYIPEKIQYRIPVLTVICNEGCGLDIPSYNGKIGGGLLAGMCTPSPCTYAGRPYYLQIILFCEHLFVFSLFIYLFLRAQRKIGADKIYSQVAV